MNLEELERELFLLDMKDHFDIKDFQKREQLVEEIIKLKGEEKCLNGKQ